MTNININADTAPTVSIVIPAFNRVDLTTKCLQALADNTTSHSYEVIIVDNASTDATPELCASLGDRATVIRNDENLGFARACNQGAAAAAADRIVFLNTDTEPLTNWLAPLVDILDGQSDVGAVGVKLLFPDRTVQHGGVAIVVKWVGARPTWTPTHFPYQVPENDRLANMRRDVLAATGACLMVRRSAFNAIGGFDEGYWNGYEDVDLCLSLGAAGWRIVYEPASVLIHHESASGPERFRREGDNIARLRERWADRVIPDFIVKDGAPELNPSGFLAAQLALVGDD